MMAPSENWAKPALADNGIRRKKRRTPEGIRLGEKAEEPLTEVSGIPRCFQNVDQAVVA